MPHKTDGTLNLAYKLRRVSEELVDASNMAFAGNRVELSSELLHLATELLNASLKLLELGQRRIHIQADQPAPPDNAA
ncbi:MAG: hypothetical protein HRJ53_07920 [Acidobacteria bacterium Pan2503]|uniref:Uncharacterized protein n=1 Tax=Candidatus Acidiferrum panamense TaxID=2741543 RepID=A0A7V8NPB5_9BACT|nr:hypothetical protein [Candidatus Acidoferrum panamensis]